MKPKPIPRRVFAALVLLVALAIVTLIARHQIAGFVLARGLALISGERVTIGAFVLGPQRSTFRSVSVHTQAGDPVLDVGRIELTYSLRELLGGSRHRFGLTDITLDDPTVTLVRHADGSYNLLAVRALTGAAPAAGRSAPFALRVRVHNGRLRLIDRAPVAPDLGDQTVSGITLDAQIASDRRSHARGSAAFESRSTAGARSVAWPIMLSALSDARRGVAIVRAHAAQLPLRGLLGFVQHSPAMRADDGLLNDLNLELFALDFGLNRPAGLHVGGNAGLSSGQLSFAALRHPIRALRGRLTLTDDGIWTTGLTGTLAGMTVRARGGAFDRNRPVVRLGVAGDGDLSKLRSLFAFSARQPASGRAHIETLIEAPVASILIRTSMTVPHAQYGSVPLAQLAGHVDYHASVVVLDAVRARYGAARLRLGGRFLLGAPTLDSAIVLAANGPGRGFPYAENLAPEAAVDAVAAITGSNGYRARGAVGLQGGGLTGRGMFAVDNRGVGEFGPFSLNRSDGSSLAGALRLERPTSQSAAWLSARRYRVAVSARAAQLAGLNLPAFPPLAGIIDARLAGGGSPDAFGLTGQLSGTGLRVGAVDLGSGYAGVSGTLRDLRLSNVTLNGALGRFRGAAAVSARVFGLRGLYAGSLDRLVPLTGPQSAYGAVAGPVAATINGSDVVVQSAGAQLQGARIRGVQIARLAGTLAVRSHAFHLVVATGSIGGGLAVAREVGANVALSAPDLPAHALRGTGLPLDAGKLSIFGLANLRPRSPSFVGTVTVADGHSRGYRVSGDAQIDLDGARAKISAATGALGSTFGSIGGSIDGVGERALRYDLATRIPLGDIAVLRGDLGLPVRYLEGSFAADVHVYGTGNKPFLEGRLQAPEGRYNGLVFRAAAARLVMDADGLAAGNGRLTVGSTQTAISASSGGGRFAIAASSRRANLADFNDYFDAGETLAGSGRFDLDFRSWANRSATHGNIAFQSLRYRSYPLGTTNAAWHTNGANILGQVGVDSPAGQMHAAASIAPAPGADPVRRLGEATYDGRATFHALDLSTWLAASGYFQPVSGKVEAGLRVTGRFPRLALAVDARLDDAKLAGFPLRDVRLSATSLGTRLQVNASHADLGFAELSGSGRLGLAPNDPLAFDLRATTANVGPAIHTFVPAARGHDLGGSLDADVRLGGTVRTPTVAGGFDINNARYGTFAVPRAIGALALTGRTIELRDADVEFARGQAFVAGSLPLQFQPFGLGPARAPLSFDVTARGVDLAQFSPLLPAGTKLGGTVDGRFGVEGTLDRPRMLGSAAIADGSYLSPFERAPIQHFNARLAFVGSSVALQTFHADVGAGTLDAGGRISLLLGGGAPTSYTLDVRAQAARLDFPAFGRGTLDGALQLAGGPGRQPLVSGNLELHDAVIPVAAVYGPAAVAGAPGATGGLPIDPGLALHAALGRNVRVRSSIVDIGVTGAVDVSGSLHAPKLAGGFSATDGTVSSYNHVFRLVNAAAIFDPAEGSLPTISARATARVTDPDPDVRRNIAGSANIVVTVNGTPDSNNLQVTYSSDPPYSQEQIVGLLLDVPALLGALNFNLNGGPGGTLLRGAPGETNGLLPPGVSPEQVSAISFNQEVFSLLNGQFTQRALNPVERVFEKIFGLSDLQFTVDYGGGLGYSLRRQIGKRDFYAFLSQTVTYPERSNFGFELGPKAFETLNFSYYAQNGVTSLITNQTPGAPFFSSSTRRFTSVQPLGNRSGFSLDFSRRF